MMAVSYGVTFAVMVVFLFIAFTGYLEVNKPRRAVFNTYPPFIDSPGFSVSGSSNEEKTRVRAPAVWTVQVQGWPTAPEEHTGAFAHLVLHFLFLIQDKSKENNENQTMHTPILYQLSLRHI